MIRAHIITEALAAMAAVVLPQVSWQGLMGPIWYRHLMPGREERPLVQERLRRAITVAHAHMVSIQAQAAAVAQAVEVDGMAPISLEVIATMRAAAGAALI